MCDEGAPSRNPPSRSKLPFLTELLLSHQQSVVTPTLSFANPALTEDFPLSTRDADGDSKREIKRGVLFKTTVSRKEGSKVGQTRQRRHFRLTDEALEYENKFNSYVSYINMS